LFKSSEGPLHAFLQGLTGGGASSTGVAGTGTALASTGGGAGAAAGALTGTWSSSDVGCTRASRWKR